jgi:hypothetical protein
VPAPVLFRTDVIGGWTSPLGEGNELLEYFLAKNDRGGQLPGDTGCVGCFISRECVAGTSDDGGRYCVVSKGTCFSRSGQLTLQWKVQCRVRRNKLFRREEVTKSDRARAEGPAFAYAGAKCAAAPPQATRGSRLDRLLGQLEAEYAVLVGQWTSDVESWRRTSAKVLRDHIVKAEELNPEAERCIEDIYVGYLAHDVCRYRRAAQVKCVTHGWTRTGLTYVNGEGLDICPYCSTMCGCTAEEGDAWAQAGKSLGVWDTKAVEAFKQRVLEGVCCEFA